jgi:hypothetical protein
MHLQFKFEVCRNIQQNEKKLTKYTKIIQTYPKFDQEVSNNVGRPKK